MEGNQLLHPRHRALLVAALFALAAGAVFLLVWQWPAIMNMFARGSQPEMTAEEIAYEEKMRTLRELEQSRGEANGAPEMTDAQKKAAVSAVSRPDESGFTQEEKYDILNSLNN